MDDTQQAVKKLPIFAKFSKITFKLPATIFLASIVAALSAGYLGYSEIKTNLNMAIAERTEIILNNQKYRLSNYLNEIKNDLHQKVISSEIGHAAAMFEQAWIQLKSDQEAKLQQEYIIDNTFETGEKEKLDFAPQETHYNRVHKKYHPRLRNFLYSRGYYDIFIINLNGDIVYSVFKELDFATNLNHGEYKDSGLGKVYRDALKLEKGQQSFDDFKPYAPSFGAPASFIAEPVFTAFGKLMGVMAFQMPIDKMNDIMKARGQLGTTGETLIVGQDGLLRSDSELNKDFKILQTQITAPILQRSQEASITFSADEVYHGHKSIMAVTNLNFQDVVWRLIAVQSYDEVFIPLINARNKMILSVLAVLSIIVIIGYFVCRTITSPLSKLTKIMSLIANGKLETKINGAERSDEIGDMAHAVLVFKDNALANVALEKQQIIDREDMTKQSEQQQQTFAKEFKDSIMGLIENVGESCQNMSHNTQGLIVDSMQSIEQANTAKTASERASMNVQNVAAASEQLSSSIEEIGRQVNQSRGIVSEAMNGAIATNKKVGELSKAANGIGEVISLIQSIAEQTNLLALNATIEAARAGDAGKGFAVVATEVKALASQTAKATEEISSHISSIQQSTSQTVTSIGDITDTMNKVNDITAVIATAVEEQGSATILISENIQEASNETNLVSENMLVVTNRADKANQSANEMSSATEIMNVQTQELQGQVDEFINKILSK